MKKHSGAGKSLAAAAMTVVLTVGTNANVVSVFAEEPSITQSVFKVRSKQMEVAPVRKSANEKVSQLMNQKKTADQKTSDVAAEYSKAKKTYDDAVKAQNAAQKALDAANNDVSAKQKAVKNAQTETDQLQNQADSLAKKADELKAVTGGNKAAATEKARQDLEKAQKEKDAASKALTDIQNSTLYKQVWATSNPEHKVPSNLESGVVKIDIPEANGAKIRFTYDGSDYATVNDANIYRALNETGSYTIPVLMTYYYKESDYVTTSTTVKRDGVEPVKTEPEVTNTGLHRLKAVWTDANGVQHVKHIELDIESYDTVWNTADYENWAKETVSKIIKPGMNPRQKAEAITNYVSQNFEYGSHSNGYSMLKDGYGDCWASTDMICELGKIAGFEARWHNDNYYAGSGSGHANAWLFSPEDNQLYECEAGYERKKQSDGTTHKDGSVWGVDSTGGNFIYDKTPAQYEDGWYSGGAEDIKSTIGLFYRYGDSEVHVPEDSSITTLGGREDGFFGSGPFVLFDNLKTVYIGKNITKINRNAYSHTENATAANGFNYGWYNNTYRFVVDPGNPAYCSDANGALYKKNADGTRGPQIFTPGNRNEEISDSDYYKSLSKTNAQHVQEYNDAAKRVKNANNAYDAANTRYNLLNGADDEKSIADKQKQTSKNLKDAKKKLTNEQSALSNAKKEAESCRKKLDQAKTATSKAEKDYQKAKNEYDKLAANVTMYRAYNPNSGEHFYTRNKKEFDHIVSLGWKNEGIGWIAPQSSKTPVYRLYNANGGEHHYTSNAKEKNALTKAGWKDEGIGWYSDDSKRTKVYREYNPNAFANNHNYTTSKKENDTLVKLGWRYEGIGWYGVRAK